MSQLPQTVVVQPPLLLSRDFIDYPYFSMLGAAQAAAVIRQCGAPVQVLDGLSGEGADLSSTEELLWLGQPRHDFLRRLGRDDGLDQALVIINASPFLLGLPGRRWLRELLARIHEARPALVVLADLYVGGMHYLETDPQSWVNTLQGDPLVLRFECELLLRRLMEEIAGGGWPRGEVWECRDPFALDDLPAPAWDLIDAGAYFDFLERTLGSPLRPGPIPARPLRTLPLVTSRGCPHDCIFCTRNPGLTDHKRAVRTIPLPRIEQWVEEWVQHLSLQRLVVLDEVANLDSQRFDALLALANRRGLKVEFPNGLRADRLTEEQVQEISRLCSGLKVSLESASPRVQDELLRKHLDPSSVERVARWCQTLGLPLGVHCLIGIPGERPSDIAATLEMATRLHEEYGAQILLQYATLLPGTELHRICEEQHLFSEKGSPHSEKLWPAFQHCGVIKTDAFDPELLMQARQVLERRIQEPPAPKVIVNLTYRCNNHCSFCAVGDRPRQDASVPDVLRALRRYRDKGYELLDLDGGEPTLHSGLFDLIQAARAMGYARVALITNGRRLSYPAYAQRLINAGLVEALVSLHAHQPALGALLCGEEGGFSQTVAGIKNLLARWPDAQELAVNTTVVAHNVAALGGMARFLEELGVRRWNLQLVTPFGRAFMDLLPEEETLRRHLGRLLDHPPPGMAIQLINCPPCLVPGHEQAAAMDFDKAHRQMVFVGAGGENLQAFLSQRRRRGPRCVDCIYTPVCAGKYAFSLSTP